jgi:hypothetical protein
MPYSKERHILASCFRLNWSVTVQRSSIKIDLGDPVIELGVDQFVEFTAMIGEAHPLVYQPDISQHSGAGSFSIWYSRKHDVYIVALRGCNAKLTFSHPLLSALSDMCSDALRHLAEIYEADSSSSHSNFSLN